MGFSINLARMFPPDGVFAGSTPMPTLRHESEVFGLLNLLLARVEPPTRRALIEHLCSQANSPAYRAPQNFLAYLQVFLADLVKYEGRFIEMRLLLVRKGNRT